MTEVKIQKATMENLKDIQELNLLLFKKEYKEYDKTLDLDWTFGEKGTKSFKNKISDVDSCAFVAIVDNKIVGYLVGGLTDPESYRILPKIAELDNMLVLEDYRNLGIGKKLYLALIDWCKSKDIKKIKVTASAQNIKAINFYKKNGFIGYDLTLERNI